MSKFAPWAALIGGLVICFLAGQYAPESMQPFYVGAAVGGFGSYGFYRILGPSTGKVVAAMMLYGAIGGVLSSEIWRAL